MSGKTCALRKKWGKIKTARFKKGILVPFNFRNKRRSIANLILWFYTPSNASGPRNTAHPSRVLPEPRIIGHRAHGYRPATVANPDTHSRQTHRMICIRDIGPSGMSKTVQGIYSTGKRCRTSARAKLHRAVVTEPDAIAACHLRLS